MGIMLTISVDLHGDLIPMRFSEAEAGAKGGSDSKIEGMTDH
jgi:hypothetical protein